MNFSSLYRLSFYVMLTLATLVLSVDATDSKIAMLYPPVVAAAGVLAFLTVDRNPRLGLSRGLANVLALACVSLSYLEYRVDEENFLLLALTHWLVYLQLIKMFLPKTVEDDWFLFLLGLTQVLAGVVMSQSDIVGVILFWWVLSALWVLSLFSLHREWLRAGRLGPAPAAGDLIAIDPYPGLLNLSFVLATLRVAATALALGGLIFLIVPRSTSMAAATTGTVQTRHLTGFDDQVRLGQMGEILENDNIVMTVEFYNQNDERIEPVGEPLFRGATMMNYREGRWHRQAKHRGDFPVPPSSLEAPGRMIQRIQLEPQDNTILFGLRPMLKAHSGRSWGRPILNPTDGTLFRDRSRRGTFDYVVESSADASIPQPGESFPSVDRLNALLGVDEPLKSRLARIARPIVAGIPEEDWMARARALEAYFRDSGRFSYTLRMDVIDPSIDPVEDFIVNRKEGHCEYFGSALTLMLRSIGIPARMVNGFKGGDWNALARVMSVRELHAHSWVEVLVGGNTSSGPEWVTLDATPAQERADSVAMAGGLAARFRLGSDFVRYVWTFYVVGFDAERQKKLIYDPIRALAQEARRGFAEMGQALRSAAGWVLDFPSFASLISVRGFLVTFVGLSLAAALFRGLAWLARRLMRSFRGARSGDTDLAAGVAFYRRLTLLLSEFGLERPAGETHREFADRAAVFLAGRGSSTEPVADVPSAVVDAFYRVRFGHREVTSAALHGLESSLDALEASLRAQQA